MLAETEVQYLAVSWSGPSKTWLARRRSAITSKHETQSTASYRFSVEEECREPRGFNCAGSEATGRHRGLEDGDLWEKQTKAARQREGCLSGLTAHRDVEEAKYICMYSVPLLRGLSFALPTGLHGIGRGVTRYTIRSSTPVTTQQSLPLQAVRLLHVGRTSFVSGYKLSKIQVNTTGISSTGWPNHDDRPSRRLDSRVSGIA